MSHHPLRVLLWSPKGAGHHYGGPGMAAFRLYQSAPPGTFHVTLAHGFPHQEESRIFARQVLIAECGPTPLAQWNFVRRGKRWLQAHSQDFDVFHGLGAYDNTVDPALFAVQHGLPAFVKVTVHGGDLADKAGFRRLLGRPRRRRKMLNRLSGVIAISSDIEAELRGYGVSRDRICAIPNGVNTSVFRPASDSDEVAALRAEFGWPSLPIVFFSGCVLPRKRPHLLVRAMVELEKRHQAIAVVLAGPGQDAEYLRSMQGEAQAAGLSDRLITAGAVRDIAPMYRAADVFCLPSESEGMPNSLLEAMASGLPVVATAVSGSRDLVKHEVNGFCIEAEVDSLVHALSHYVTDANLRAAHGRQALETIMGGYSNQQVCAAHAKLFREHVRVR